MITLLLIFLMAIVVGVLGSMLGIGGGVLIIPLLTMLFNVDIKHAIGASIVSVVATSSAAGAVYVGHGMTHTRLAMTLEVATTLGALAGGLTAVLVNPRLLYVLFGLVLVYVIYNMRRAPREEVRPHPTGTMDTRFFDPLSGQVVTYGVRNVPAGLTASFVAGNISGLLGIGGGIIKVPIMNLVMGMPLKAAIATSNFMIGVTAATSAVIYYGRGYIDPAIAVPLALGILIGAQVGPRILGRTHSSTIRTIFQVLLLFFAIQMLWKAITFR